MNTYKYIDDQTIEIELTQGMTCLIDADDYDLVKDYHWCYNKSKRWRTGYVQTSKTLNHKCNRIHRIILRVIDPKIHIDHINGIGTDNRKSNLRICDLKSNTKNRRKSKNNTSGYKGVTYRSDCNRYRARIQYNRKPIDIGYYSSAEDAARAYDTKAIELFGEFANLNFKIDTSL